MSDERTAYEIKIEALRDRFTRSVSKVAADVRKRLVVPLCDTHRLDFISEKGAYFFGQQDGSEIEGSEDARKKGLLDVAAVFSVLDIPVGPEALGHYVVSYVANYNPVGGR